MKLFSKHRSSLLGLALRGLLMTPLYAGLAVGAYGVSPPVEKLAKTEEATEGIEVTLKLNLGTIELQNLEPTQGRTAHMSFDLHLTFDPNTDPKFLKELEGWQHRLREQVIVAVRTTDIFDFLDPELKRFRKQILYRINRMLKDPVVTDALFANFTFSSQ
jgi:hypothetical protein